MNDNNLKFSDEVIAQIAKLVQMAILSGTDIVDNFRMLRFKLDDTTLYLGDTYKQQFTDNIEKMLEEIKESPQNEGE